METFWAKCHEIKKESSSSADLMPTLSTTLYLFRDYMNMNDNGFTDGHKIKTLMMRKRGKLGADTPNVNNNISIYIDCKSILHFVDSIEFTQENMEHIQI